MWDAGLCAGLEDGSTWGEPAARSLALLLRVYAEGNCSRINHLSSPAVRRKSGPRMCALPF